MRYNAFGVDIVAKLQNNNAYAEPCCIIHTIFGSPPFILLKFNDYKKSYDFLLDCHDFFYEIATSATHSRNDISVSGKTANG